MSDVLWFSSLNGTVTPTGSPKFGTNHETTHGLSFASHTSYLDPANFATLLRPYPIFILILIFFSALNRKSFPFIWHLRVLNAFRFTIRTLRPQVRPRPSMVFQPMITSSSADLAEMDFNLHKTNSSYFADADIARAHLMSTLFAPAIEHMRGGSGAYTGAGAPLFGLALGAVSCSFRREIHPGSSFDMWTRILSWDDKWFYIATHFVRKGAGNPGTSSLYPDQGLRGGSKSFNAERDLYATALSRCVFKSGRKTASPADMLRMACLVPNDDAPSVESDEETDNEIRDFEEHRQCGMKLASMLTKENQLALEAEFHGGEGEVLGRHTDGTGVAGVVLTLLQLVGLKRKWYL
ncbi:putative thioesterase atnL [Colletotrichum spaethianum]|uniref:Thioesterase atnL n=1 Tax=Colletotrichum spaethianum TaxID=700344 RepID=A0AA37NWT7_9PEZI|nr:putative thioesterase atnL [Colletotrichum spaethianum]GKT41660.1 putative thioesterase atnL [Colletotrichum spaethianum]